MHLPYPAFDFPAVDLNIALTPYSGGGTRANSKENLPRVFQAKFDEKPTFGKVVMNQVKE